MGKRPVGSERQSVITVIKRDTSLQYVDPRLLGASKVAAPARKPQAVTVASSLPLNLLTILIEKVIKSLNKEMNYRYILLEV